MTKTFSVGDKVFAKVRGYPAWPARVDKITEASSNKRKYQVFFYGTYETAVCKVEDLFNYEEHKEKYGKPLKRRGFNEALAQIEGLISVPVSGKEEITAKEGHEDSDTEGKLIIDENPKPLDGKKKVVKRKCDNDAEVVDGQSVNNAHNHVGSQKRVSLQPQKRFKNVSSSSKDGSSGNVGSSEISTSSSSSIKTEIISRSGRKIKPKKFADEVAPDSTTDVDGEANLKVNTEQAASKIQTLPDQLGNKKQENAKKNTKVNMGPPSGVRDPVPGCSTMQSERSNVEVRKTAVLNNKHLSKLDRLMWFRNEARMVEIDALLRYHLCIHTANTAESINLLKQLCDLDIQPLMLKKHPQVLKNIKKVRRYTGNTEEWNLSDDEARKFSDDASQIRTIADTLFTKFRDMFIVPEGRTFWEVFLDEVSVFQKRVESLPMEKLCSLVIDPTCFRIRNTGRKSRPVEKASCLVKEIETEPAVEDQISDHETRSHSSGDENPTETGILKTGSKTSNNENEKVESSPMEQELDVNKVSTKKEKKNTE